MNYNQVIEIADSFAPNELSDVWKMEQLYNFECEIMSEVMLMSQTDIDVTDMPSGSTELLVSRPHCRIYWLYLTCMIHQANRDYEALANETDRYNAAYCAFIQWYARNNKPANGKCEFLGYYMSAYAIAVKHGYAGTESEWLASLKGDKGDTGATGAKIVSTVFVAEDADGGNIYKQTFDNGATAEFTAPKGDKGATGDKGAKGDTGATGAQGEAGGYYTPAVDSAGNLSWSASKSGMPGVSGVNIKGAKGDTGDKGEKGEKGDQGMQGIQGEKGDTGNSGTYIGDTEPTDPDVDVWIQPDGDECGLLLPVVTSEDDGKIPMVVDGAWHVTPAPIVSGHRLTDMTYAEFETAVKDPDTYYFVYDPEVTQ